MKEKLFLILHEGTIYYVETLKQVDEAFDLLKGNVVAIKKHKTFNRYEFVKLKKKGEDTI